MIIIVFVPKSKKQNHHSDFKMVLEGTDKWCRPADRGVRSESAHVSLERPWTKDILFSFHLEDLFRRRCIVVLLYCELPYDSHQYELLNEVIQRTADVLCFWTLYLLHPLIHYRIRYLKNELNLRLLYLIFRLDSFTVPARERTDPVTLGRLINASFHFMFDEITVILQIMTALCTHCLYTHWYPWHLNEYMQELHFHIL